MRSNYVAMGDWTETIENLFKDDDEIEIDTSKNWNESCPSGTTRKADGSCKETSCPPGYRLDYLQGCVRNSSASTICPAGLHVVLRDQGGHDCVSCPPGMETRSPHDPTCVPGAFTGGGFTGGASLSAGGSVADFFANLFGGGSSTTAPATSSGGGTISPGTPVPRTIPGTSYVIPDKGAGPSPVVAGTAPSSNLPTALLVLGAVGLMGGGIYLVTR